MTIEVLAWIVVAAHVIEVGVAAFVIVVGVK